MKYTKKDLPKSQVELVITVEPADYNADLQKAAITLSQRAAIKGFRPGKAPYDTVKQQVGEVKIFETAMQNIVESNYSKAIKEASLETIGMPQISIEKMAPGNDFEFKATVALMPSIKLGNIAKIKIQKKTTKIDDAKTEEVLANLSKMQAKEVVKTGKATKKDKVTIDMEMFLDKVPVEGGQAKKHGVYLSEQHYIPGLDEKLIGLSKGDEKEFDLKFPAEHYQKHLAGKKIDFKIKVIDVFEMQYPEINDEFAKSLGLENLDKLRATLKENLQKEEEKKEDQRVEIEIFDKLIEATSFDDIPEVLIKYEKEKMFHELKSQLAQQGIDMEKYLSDLKKTEEEIHNDFAVQADKRAKAALVSRAIAIEQKMQPEKKEIDDEIALIRKTYKDDKTVEENLKRPEVIETLAVAVQNKKVIKYLKETVLADK